MLFHTWWLNSRCVLRYLGTVAISFVFLRKRNVAGYWNLLAEVTLPVSRDSNPLYHLISKLRDVPKLPDLQSVSTICGRINLVLVFCTASLNSRYSKTVVLLCTWLNFHFPAAEAVFQMGGARAYKILVHVKNPQMASIILQWFPDTYGYKQIQSTRENSYAKHSLGM